MVYQWKTPIYKVDANLAGAEIEACRNEHGIIKPASVVARAQSAASPIHDCFEWDDETAAARHREDQARALMRNIVAVVETKDERPLTINAFVNISSDVGRGYKGIIQVMQNPADRAYLLQAALGELSSIRKKYNDLSELAGVFDAVDAAVAAERAG